MDNKYDHIDFNNHDDDSDDYYDSGDLVFDNECGEYIDLSTIVFEEALELDVSEQDYTKIIDYYKEYIAFLLGDIR